MTQLFKGHAAGHRTPFFFSLSGVWRKTNVSDYRNAEPKWQTLLDVDRLAEKEHEDWVFVGTHCLAPLMERCMIRLSRGGKDAAVLREFDLSRREFVGAATLRVVLHCLGVRGVDFPGFGGESLARLGTRLNVPGVGPAPAVAERCTPLLGAVGGWVMG